MLTGINILQPTFQFDEMRNDVLKKLSTQLAATLSYHNYEHTLNVERISEEIAIHMKLSAGEIKLIKTAALYHDLGFIHQHEHNEALAIQMAERELPKFNYSEKEIKLVATMIHSTRFGYDAENMYDQIISDADHDYFGREDYFEIATRLRKEFSFYGKNFSELEWIDFQLNYLEDKHVYQTEWSLNNRANGKRENIQQLKAQKQQFSA